MREFRKSNGLTQAQVAERLGVSRSTLAQMETGRRAIRADEIAALSTLFGCSPTDFISSSRGEAVSSPPQPILDEILEAVSGPRVSQGLRRELQSILSLAELLSDTEAALGLDALSHYSPEYSPGEPTTAWEAVFQGYRAAEDERKRLGLGDSPVRFVDELIGSLRIRAGRAHLPGHVRSLFVRAPSIGDVVIVNRSSDPGWRRFSYAHGFAHSLFDHDGTWRLCMNEENPPLPEIRANAFASAFLLPAQGVCRYLESLGKETLGRTGAVVLEMAVGGEAGSGGAGSYRVDGRGRRGRQPINLYDLARVARYYGVARSLAVFRLRNLRLLTEGQLESLQDLDRGEGGRSVEQRLILRGASRTGDSLRSRVAALTAEAYVRGSLSREKFDEHMAAVDLEVEDRLRLLELTRHVP